MEDRLPAILSASSEQPVLSAADIAAAMNGTLDVWFLHVGHGDCAIVRHPDGRFTMLDVHLRRPVREHVADVVFEHAGVKPVLDVVRGFESGARSDGPPLADPIEFLQALGAKELYRLVLTHPDLDHLRGLSRLVATMPVRNLWDTHNLKWVPPWNIGRDSDAIDWTTYLGMRTLKTQTTVLRILAGQSAPSWTNHNIEVLAPGWLDVATANIRGAWNAVSYVLRVTHGESSVLFAGDAEADTLDRLAVTYGGRLKSTVLKASHHGRASGWSAAFVREVAPAVTVVSSGEKDPRHDAAHRYARNSRVLETRVHGTVGFRLFRDGRCEQLIPETPAHWGHAVGRVLGLLGRLAG
jgi:competence protein ComEC